MTIVEQMAALVERCRFEDLSPAARDHLKVCLLDALGCAVGALGGGPVRAVRAHVEEFGGAPLCSLIGGGRSAPDRAALMNGAAVRYLDFNDSYLAPGETCHPSDSLGGVLAAAEYAGRTGRDLLTALAVAYFVQCRLSEAAPVRDRGFDHTVQGAYGAAAGVSKALGLDAARTAHAMAVAGTAYNALRITRTGALSHWKGLASPHAVAGATQAVFLARRGITGPLEVFEGKKGFMESFARPFILDWQEEDLERVTRVILKKYNAEIHSQSVLEAALALRSEHAFTGDEVDRVEVDVFDVAYNIIGGGEEGKKTEVRTKEEADHSLPYLVAVALLDGRVMPDQYAPERIARADVQRLLRRVEVRPSPEYSRDFPGHMRCHVIIHLRDGRALAREQRDYEGFHTDPMSWETVKRKFESLSEPLVPPALRTRIIETVGAVESTKVSVLADLLSKVRAPAAPAPTGR